MIFAYHTRWAPLWTAAFSVVINFPEQVIMLLIHITHLTGVVSVQLVISLPDAFICSQMAKPFHCVLCLPVSVCYHPHAVPTAVFVCLLSGVVYFRVFTGRFGLCHCVSCVTYITIIPPCGIARLDYLISVICRLALEVDTHIFFFFFVILYGFLCTYFMLLFHSIRKFVFNYSIAVELHSPLTILVMN